MSHHKNKRILLGVTGGIAAYKSPEIVRRLIDRGCHVRVVMTASATAFITPLTLQAVSGHPVYQRLLDTDAESGMGHIELARWAEQIIVAPATANFIAKLANGEADDLLSTLCLASTAEIAVAPAMNQQMWQHKATIDNLALLERRGVQIIGPDSGDQACGEIGPGRMTAPEEIANILAGDVNQRIFSGKRILITAGPTWEAVDPVRGFSNHSSGKMGYAMAEAAADFGAEVTLISGPVHLDISDTVKRVDVISARDMLDAVMDAVIDADIFISVAAVADFRPATVANQKIKKSDDNENINIEMVRNPDILATVATLENPPFTVGFAAETENIIENARAKLISKKVDVIAANDVSGEDGAFGSDRNSVTLVHQDDEIIIPSNDKYAVAIQLLEHINNLRNL